MIFVTGPLFAGKEETICKRLGWSREDFQKHGIRDVQELAGKAEDLAALADQLAADYTAVQEAADALSQKAVVIATEVGGGIVPMDAGERHNREQAGRLACLLAERADTVVRVCCGIPQVLKGELP